MASIQYTDLAIWLQRNDSHFGFCLFSVVLPIQLSQLGALIIQEPICQKWALSKTLYFFPRRANYLPAGL